MATFPRMADRSALTWWVLTALAAVGAAVLVVVLLTRSDEPSASTEPPPTPVVEQEDEAEPDEEEPTPTPVAGEVSEVTITDLSITGSALRPDGSPAEAPVAVQQDAVDATVDAATAWLDAHLTAAQDGEPGLLPDGLDGPIDAATTGLAHPDRAVTTASYTVTMGVRGVPEWIRVGVAVSRDDGTSADATFVFVPTDADLEVIAVLPGDGTDVPEEAA